MEKKALMEKLARAAYEKGSFNGTWLYAENGKIVSKGAYGWRDAENKLPMQEDTIDTFMIMADRAMYEDKNKLKYGRRKDDKRIEKGGE